MASTFTNFALLAVVLAAGCARSPAPAANADAGVRLPMPADAAPDPAYEPHAFAYVFADPQCRPHLSSLHRVPGVPHQWIAAALAGDAASSERIHRNLLVRIERDHEHRRVPGLACAYQYWADIAAQHGDIHAAYEASFPRPDSPVRCARAKTWAAFGLAHLEEYREGYVADAPPELVESGLRARREQFEQTLATACPPATPAAANPT